MKITFILPGRTSSGGVRCISLVGQRLLERNHEVRILSRKQTPTFRDRCRSIQSRLFYPSAPDWIQQFQGAMQDFTDLAECAFEPDEILVAVGMAECAQLDRVAHLPNVKVQYLHGSTPYAPDLVKKTLALRLPKIVVASYLKDLVQTQGYGEDVVAVVHNGVNRKEYFPSVTESERDGVGAIYGQHKVKDPDTLIRSLDVISSHCPMVPIRVFSTDRRPKEIRRSTYWRTPTLVRSRDIYSRSLVWIVASRSEGFAMPALEAMACGCVVVATDCGGPRDIIQDGVNGFLVPVGDSDAIVDRAQLLLGDASLRTSMQKRGLETARHFTWDKCVTELETALELATHACV